MLPFPCLLSPSYFRTRSSHCPSVHFGFLFFLQSPSLLRSLPRPTFLPHRFPKRSSEAAAQLCWPLQQWQGELVVQTCWTVRGAQGGPGFSPQGPHSLNREAMAGAVGHLSHKGASGCFRLWRGRYQVWNSDWDRNLLVYGTSTQRNLSLEWGQRSKGSPHFRPSSLVPPVGELQIVLLMGTFPAPKEFGNKHSYMF